MSLRDRRTVTTEFKGQRILNELLKDPTRSLEEIARACGSYRQKVWREKKKMEDGEAIWGYTMGPALASGREAELGSIAPGKLADLIVLDRDILKIPPMEIHQTRVKLTVFDGQIVYES